MTDIVERIKHGIGDGWKALAMEAAAEIGRLQERNQEHEARYDALEALESERKAEVERLQCWRADHPYSELDLDMHVAAVTKELRAEIARLQALLREAANEIDELGFPSKADTFKP